MPDAPPDFQSSVPEFNHSHQTLQRATEIAQRPPSPEPETIDSLIDIGSIFNAGDHGFGELNTDEFQIHGQLEQVQANGDKFFILDFSFNRENFIWKNGFLTVSEVSKYCHL